MMDSSLAPNTIAVPPEHVLVNKKFEGTQLGELFSRENVFIFSDTGFVDFFASGSSPFIYITDFDIANKAYVRRIEQLAKAYQSKGIVITKRGEDFNAIQTLVVLEREMTIFPVCEEEEIPSVLKHWAYAESHPEEQEQAFIPDSPASKVEVQIALLTVIPDVDAAMAHKLLSMFGGVRGVSSASVEALEKVAGAATAEKIRHFFHNERTS